MKKNMNDKNVKGYIEGYYGKILTWKSRDLIIKSLSKNKLNFYLYAPKEDIHHRLNWKKDYSKKWRLHFRKFSDNARRKNIKVIAGIAPGLDFNFNEISNKTKLDKNSDFALLVKKAKQLLYDGATSIALLLDDIPANFTKKFGKQISEGEYHGILANKLLKELGEDIYFVPRVYADELIQDDPLYLIELSKVLNPKINVFYSGKNVVSECLTNYQKINSFLKNRIIFWDNFYANDYCPRRLFIGPYIGRQKINDIMINPTGLIKTDLLILDIYAKSISGKVFTKDWEKIINFHGVPKAFLKIKKFFLKPDFGSNPLVKSVSIKKSDFETLDFLLWKWKGKLSREWYPFMLGLKQDLQIKKNLLTSERKIKTQTIPLSEFLIKGEL